MLPKAILWNDSLGEAVRLKNTQKGKFMAKAIILSLSNPVSKEREAEYNDWFEKIHAVEVTALEGVRNIRRFRAAIPIVPPDAEPAYLYAAIYELDDAQTASTSLTKAAPTMTWTDAIDQPSVISLIYEEIFSLEG
jgi:hypothetical protein